MEIRTIKYYRETYNELCYNKINSAGTWNMPKDFEPWNKGKHLSVDYKEKISKSTKLAMQNPETRKKILARNEKYLYGNHHHKKGSKLTKEQKINISVKTKEAMSKIHWIYVNNGKRNQPIKEENLQKYLDLGWKEGKKEVIL